MAPAQGLKVGDLVQLLSGGPVMTVQTVRVRDDAQDESIKCYWFAGAELHKGWFNPATLQAAVQPAPKPWETPIR